LSDEAEITDEVEQAARVLDNLISAHLAAGGNRFVLAAACVWGGVKEMSEITSSQSAAAALRAIASQIDPPIDMPGAHGAGVGEDALMAAVRGQGPDRGAARSRSSPKSNPKSNPKPVDDAQLNPVNQELAGDVIGEAIDLIDQAQPDLARALLLALRARLLAGPRPQAPPPPPRRRWGL
jgi:hypothetical protein